MTKCLVTKHIGVSNDDSLFKVGEMRIGVPNVANPTYGTQVLRLSFTNPTKLTILGDGYFTDSTLTKNYGKEIMSNDINISNNDFIVKQNADVNVSIENKYNIKLFDMNFQSEASNKTYDISELKYSKSLMSIRCKNSLVTGDLSDISNFTDMKYLDVSNSLVTGDLSDISNLTKLIQLVIDKNIKGDLSSLSNLTALTSISLMNTSITGDLSSLSNLTALTSISLMNTSITGDLSFYANKPNMKYVATDCKMTGDVANLKNCPKLNQFSCGSTSILSGDISQLPAKCKHFNMTGEGVSGLTWSTRPSSSSIVGMLIPQWAPSNLDKVLQDLSACQVIQTSSDPVYYKRISLGGKRTAASDDAVATLQSKGFSVEVAK